MKFLKTYNSFNEDITTEPDIKMAEEKIETMKKQLDDYKAKKSQIESLYKDKKDPTEIQKGLESILGKTDISVGMDRNPFLVEWANVIKLEYDIKKYTDDNMSDKVKLDDFRQEYNYTTDTGVKESVKKKIDEITKRMSERSAALNETKKQLDSAKKEHDERVKKNLEYVKTYISKITPNM